MCDCTSEIKTPLPHAWRKRDERNTGYDWAHTAITQLAMKNAIATRNRLREGLASAGAERGGRRQRLTRGATSVSALSNSQNIAKLLTRIILRVVLLPSNEVKPASGITACELPSSEKLRQSKMTSVL